MRLLKYLNEEIVVLLITYPEAVSMKIEKDVEKIFLETIPLPKSEKIQAVKGWKAKSTTMIMLTIKNAGKYKSKVKSFIDRKYNQTGPSKPSAPSNSFSYFGEGIGSKQREKV